MINADELIEWLFLNKHSSVDLYRTYMGTELSHVELGKARSFMETIDKIKEMVNQEDKQAQA